MEKVTAVSLCLCSVMSVQSFCGEDEGFCGEDKGFCGKDEGFLAKTKDFLLFLHLRQKSFVCAILFAMFTLYTNEGSTCTEHVQTYY